MKKTIIIIAVSLLSACSASVKKVELTEQDILSNPYVSFNAPQQGWYVLNDKEWSWRYKDTKSEDRRWQWQNIYNKDYVTFGIKVGTSPELEHKKYILFDKNADYDAIGKKSINSERNLKVNKIQGITYRSYRTAYIQGLKCFGLVFLRGTGGSYAPSGRKHYNLRCGYFHKTETLRDSMRIVDIGYSVTFSNDESEQLKRDKQQALKEAVKQIVDTLKIKNMDMERMQAAGLLYPDKQFEISPW